MSNYRNIFISVTCSIISAFIIVKSVDSNKEDSRDGTYKRVIETGILRCGYILWPTFVERDPNTGNLSGAYYEFMESLASRMGIKIEWVRETPLADMFTALNAGQFDAICAGIWSDERRSLHGEFTTPMAYSLVFAYVRKGSELHSISEINSPSITISTIDGEMSQLTRVKIAPNAKEYSMSKDTHESELILTVAKEKSDLTFTDRPVFDRYNSSNPDTIVQLGDKPISAHGLTTVLKKGESSLKSALDVATQSLLLSGEVDRILDKYDPNRRTVSRVNPPFFEK